mgnify:CR=1 FL=1
MYLSDHVSLREVEKSQTALRMGIKNKASDVPEAIPNLVALSQTVIEPIRKEFGPVSISSGFRHPDLSEALKSSSKSQHCFGEALDFECFQSPGNRAVVEWIVSTTISWDQVILEYEDPEDKFAGWIHISNKICKRDNRKQILRAVKEDGKTKYLPGLN